ncbi:MAG TPA: glycoside hydrolase domain-containing protein [Longimicrobium sp.]|nr:glycoside hydrolase domain-containing protein [Longimicrobium sp.]
MSIQGTVQQAAPGLLGFDINADISAINPKSNVEYARELVQAGYRYCLRYVPVGELLDPDLTAAEAEAILAAGLALMPVQHVFEPGWLPTGPMGTQVGQRAVQWLQGIGFPGGVNVWCDLEGVGNTSAQQVIDYCKSWYAAVKAAGYVPGLYVGYGVVLHDQQLYDLPFQHYWAAYNTDSSIPTRGWQLKQASQHTHVGSLDYDDDTTHTDALGGTVLWLTAG